MMKTIYLDNAATSYPKPEAVAESIGNYIRNVGATINRSSYGAAQEAGLTAYTLRESLARLFHFPHPADHVILTAGATMGLNMILKGLLRPGDRCLVSSMEHNAVMRPLTELAARGVLFDRIPCDGDGLLDPERIIPLLSPDTRLVLITHASNVSGGILDIGAVGRICADRGIFFAVDAAQTAGHLPVDFSAARCSALCVPGHKGLLGPQGIGALLLTPELAKALSPLITGGTGSASDSEIQPAYMPDRFESGTANMPGIYGLAAALDFLENTGIEKIRAHELALTEQFLRGLSGIPGVRAPGPSDPALRAGVVSVDFAGKDNAACGYFLEREYGILTRCGLHCAPAAHRTLGTFPRGTVRFSFSIFNTPEDIDAALDGVRHAAAGNIAGAG